MVVSLHVAVQHGPYLHPNTRVSDVWSLRIPVRFFAPIFPADLLARIAANAARFVTTVDTVSTCGSARFSSIWSDFSKAAIHLRTVIVTAAVHRGFSSSLSALPLTFRHWAGVSPYT